METNTKITDTLLIQLEDLVFQTIGKPIVFRTRLSRYDDGSVFFYEETEGIWVEDTLEEIDLIIAECCDKIGCKGDTRDKLTKCFKKSHTRNFEKFNLDGHRYFLINDGVIDLIVLLGKQYKTVEDMLEYKNEWLLPFSQFKKNFFTTKSPITLFSNFNQNECNKKIEYFINVLTVSMCGRRDYAETLFDFISLVLYGKRKTHYFYHYVGNSQSGKTHIMEVLRVILGGKYFCRMPIDVFKKKDITTRKTLYTNQFARCININEIENLPDSLDQIKTILGENAVPFEFADFYLNATLFIDNNELYDFRSKSASNREILFPFGFADENTKKDPTLLDKLIEITPYIFLEMLRRLSNLDINNIVIPECTTEVRSIYKQMMHPEETFRDIFVSTDAHGKTYPSDRIYHDYFLKSFDIWYKGWVSSFPWARELELPKLTNIKITDLEKCFQERFHNWTKYENSHKYSVFYNLVIGAPGAFETMRNRHKNDLMLRLQITENAAEDIIVREEGVSLSKIREDQYEDDFRDVIGAMPPEQWKKNLLYKLCNAFGYNDFTTLSQFKNVFSDSIQSLEQSNQLFNILQTRIYNNSCNFYACYNDSVISDAINKLFEYFVRWRRADCKMKKGISPTDPRIALSPLFPVIPAGSLQQFSVLPGMKNDFSQSQYTIGNKQLFNYKNLGF